MSHFNKWPLGAAGGSANNPNQNSKELRILSVTSRLSLAEGCWEKGHKKWIKSQLAPQTPPLSREDSPGWRALRAAERKCEWERGGSRGFGWVIDRSAKRSLLKCLTYFIPFLDPELFRALQEIDGTLREGNWRELNKKAIYKYAGRFKELLWLWES